MIESSFQSAADGWTIHTYRWPAQEARAICVISHGMAEHAGRYDRFARALNDAGFDVWAVDHRAHGKTLGPGGPGDFGDGGWDALVEDLQQLVLLAKNELSTLPVVLFGHSMGAAAAQQYAPLYSGEIDLLILSGSTLRRVDEPIPVYNQPFEPARTEYDWLSRDPVEVDKYINDPLCGFEGQTVRNGMDRNDPRRDDLDRLKQIRSDLPVLVVAGDADPVNREMVGIRYLVSRWHEAGVSQIDECIYEGGRHEMLNETNRDEVTSDIIHWLNQNLG